MYKRENASKELIPVINLSYRLFRRSNSKIFYFDFVDNSLTFSKKKIRIERSTKTSNKKQAREIAEKYILETIQYFEGIEDSKNINSDFFEDLNFLNRPKITSYAQNLEDILLHRVLHDVSNGFYVDVGAYSPDIDSVTKLFYMNGWSGVNIEPLPDKFNEFLVHRSRDYNFNYVIGTSKKIVNFFEVEMPAGKGLSTLSQSYATEYKKNPDCRVTKKQCKSIPLSSLLSEVKLPSNIHFLKIDVEGHEVEVLKSCDFKKFRPWILIIEGTKPNDPKPIKDIHDLVNDCNYSEVFFDGLNYYFVSNEKLKKLKPRFYAPPNVFDNYQTQAFVDISREKKELENSLKNERNKTNSTLEEKNKIESLYLATNDLSNQRLQEINIKNERLSEQIQLVKDAASKQDNLEKEINNQVIKLQKVKSEFLIESEAQEKAMLKLEKENDKITAQVDTFAAENKALEKAMLKLEKENEKITAQVDTFAAENKALEKAKIEFLQFKEKLDLQKTLLSISESSLTQVNNILKKYEQENNQYKTEILSLTESNLEISNSLNDIEIENEKRFFLIASKDQEIRDKNDEIVSIYSELENLRDLAQQREQLINKQQKLLEKLEETKEQLKNSFSWKITAPFRLAIRAITQPFKFIQFLGDNLIIHIQRNYWLTINIIEILNRFPLIKSRLKNYMVNREIFLFRSVKNKYELLSDYSASKVKLKKISRQLTNREKYIAESIYADSN